MFNDIFKIFDEELNAFIRREFKNYLDEFKYRRAFLDEMAEESANHLLPDVEWEDDYVDEQFDIDPDWHYEDEDDEELLVDVDEDCQETCGEDDSVEKPCEVAHPVKPLARAFYLGTNTWTPTADGTAYMMTIGIPCNKEDVTVTVLDGDRVQVKYGYNTETTKDGCVSSSSFAGCSTYDLPFLADESTLTSKFEDNFLTLTVKKHLQTCARERAIKVE